jgi:hypothetical protein
MARIWDEKFEGAGYEETWSPGEILGAGCTLDEDYACSSIGSPSTWDSQCLQCVVDTAGDANYVRHNFGSDIPIAYYRVEFIVHSLTLASYADMNILRVVDSGFGSLFAVTIYNDATNNRLCFYRSLDAPETHHTGAILTLDQKYRVEVKWDNTNDAWEWKVDGSSQHSGSFTGDNSSRNIYLGSTSRVNETYIDNFAIDDSGWVGAEAAGGGVGAIKRFGGVPHVAVNRGVW